jgi:hypothetical protein
MKNLCGLASLFSFSTSKIEALEREVDELKSKLHTASVAGQASGMPLPHDSSGAEASSWLNVEHLAALPMLSPFGSSHHPASGLLGISPTSTSSSQMPLFSGNPNPLKRRRTNFELESIPASDFVTMGLVTLTDAEDYFQTFFKGCHQYVPVLDQRFDTVESIRSRSNLLFSIICATGCRILKGTDSQAWHLLNFHIKGLLNVAMGPPSDVTLETIQALLIRACYVSERSFLMALASRFAVGLGLPIAFDEMSTRCVSHSDTTNTSPSEQDAVLMRQSRTWLHILNMGHILHVDAGDPLLIRFRGNARRSRVLLQSALRTDLDLHLISQVELNVLRAEAYSALSKTPNMSEDDALAIIGDSRMDMDVWSDDWLRIFPRASSKSRECWLAQNLRIQLCWANAMAVCRAIRVLGVDNVDAMSPSQREMLTMAKASLREHLDIITQEPRDYLKGLRFAMDFVWAKCAFCFLLLLKLSMLLPDNCLEDSRKLIEHGRTLLEDLHVAGGGNANGSRSGTRRVYLQLLQVGLAKFSRTVFGEDFSPPVQTSRTGTNTPTQRSHPANKTGEENESESFVPEQFVFEWDFPGLSLFSSPVTEARWLDEFLRDALIGDEAFSNIPYNPMYSLEDIQE